MILAIAGVCGGTPLVPKIISQPTTVVAAAGQIAKISIVATGVGILYQWYKAGVPVSGQTSSSLVIENCQESDSGSYSCVVSNENGSATSNPIELTVLAGVPQITAQPQNQSIYENQSALLSVSVSVPEGQTITYQWQYSLNGGSTWANSGLATSGGMNGSSIELTLVGVVLDGILLRCKVTSVQTGFFVTSDSAQISVTQVFVSQPQDIQNTIGDVVISCELMSSASCKLQRSVNFGAFVDVDENYVGMTNAGPAATTQTGTQIQLQGNPQEPYIYESRYRIKVNLFDSVTYSAPANVSKLLRPNSISIKTPARARAVAQLLQSIPNTEGLVFSWEYYSAFYQQQTFVPINADASLTLHLSLSQAQQAGSVSTATITVAPALEIMALTVPPSKRQLEPVLLSVTVGSADSAENLSYSWSSNKTQGSFASTKDVSGAAYHPGYKSPLESEAVAEGDAWYQDDSTINCAVSDTLGNTVYAYALPVAVSTIQPVVASGYKTSIYVISNQTWTLLDFGFSVSSNNAPAGRRVIGVHETINTLEPSVYLLADAANQTRQRADQNVAQDTVSVKFFNEFGETSSIVLNVNWGFAAGTEAIHFIPEFATANNPVGITNGQSENFEISTGTKPESFTWRILQSGSETSDVQYSLPPSSSSLVSGNYYITFLVAGTFEVELKSENAWGSRTTTRTVTVS